MEPASQTNTGRDAQLPWPSRLVAIVASLPLFWFAWTRRGEAWIAAFLGVQLVVFGLRLLYWGYSMGEELVYRKKQAEQRAHGAEAGAKRSGDSASA